jgi:hypothetical protein
MADLHRRRAHASGHCMNKSAMRPARRRRLCHARLPVSKIGGEVIDGEGGGLFVGPMLWHWPEHLRVGARSLGERSPLDVAHHAASTGFFHAREFPPGDQRRRRGSGITALSGHEVREVQASGSNADQRLTSLQSRFGCFLDGERVRASETGDH